MPKFFWLFVAGALAGERWGWMAALAMLGAEAIGHYVSGFYEAWKADRYGGPAENDDERVA